MYFFRQYLHKSAKQNKNMPSAPSCSRKSTIEKSFFIIKDNTSSVSLWLTPFSLWLGHARVLTALGLSFIPLASLRYPQEKALYPLFLLHMQAQKKKLQKRKRRKEISRSAEHDKGDLPLTQPPFEKGGRKLYYGAKTLFWRSKNKVKTQSLLNTVKYSSKGDKINESYI